MTKLFDIPEVARQFDCSANTVRRKIYSGELSYFRIGNQIRFSQEQIDVYLGKCTVPAAKAGSEGR